MEGSFSASSLTGLYSALAEIQRKGQICVLREARITLHAYRTAIQPQLSTVLPDIWETGTGR